MLSSDPFDFWTMASFEDPDHGGSDYWMDHLRYRADVLDWQYAGHAAYDESPVVLTSPTKGDALPIDLARWSYDDEAVAGDLEQYRRNLQDIADRISEELSGFEPRAHDRPVTSVESADADAPYAAAKQDVIEATTKLSLKSTQKKKRAPGSISMSKASKPDSSALMRSMPTTPSDPAMSSPKSPRKSQERPVSRGRHASRRDGRRG